MKIATILLFGLLAGGIIIWLGNILLTLLEGFEREDEIFENFKLESEEQESCQNGGNPAEKKMN